MIPNGAINKRRRCDIRDKPTSYLGSYFPDSCKHHIHISLHLLSYNPAERVRKLIVNSLWFLCDLCWPAGSQPTRLPSREDLTQNNQPAARASRLSYRQLLPPGDNPSAASSSNFFNHAYLRWVSLTTNPAILFIEYLLSLTPRSLAFKSTFGFSIVPPVTLSGEKFRAKTILAT